jgi:hypothetical protein
MLKKYTGKLYCFSPPVMLATFLFEFGSAFYVLWRYKMSTVTRLIVTMLFSLGVFQLSEYMICGGLGLHGSDWARLGYVSITLLPPLGIHLTTVLAGKKSPLLISLAYGSMAAFVMYFALSPGGVTIQECRPNYAVFDLHSLGVLVYAAYYYGWLFTNVLLAWNWSRSHSKRSASLQWLTAGILLFMVPTTTANLIDPSTIAGIPSIMCGFAVLLAVVLVGMVLPKSQAVSVLRTVKKRHA